MGSNRKDANRDRCCPICGGMRLDVLHRQKFLLPGDVLTHYVVVACDDCGFTFARDLPSAAEYETYYRTNLKYTYEGSRDASEALLSMYRGSVALVDHRLASEGLDRSEIRVLDVGCSTGELLALFQRSGYQRLEGVDPTPECREIAKQLYGLDIRTAVLSELRADDPYDVVLFANTLEHIPDLRDALERLVSLVRKDGLIFIQVPDAAHFGVNVAEPFFEFSIEHINYFTATSLANLLSGVGMSPIAIRHDRLSYKTISYPVITSLWRKTPELPTADTRTSDTTHIRAYIETGKLRLAELSERIDALVASGEPVIVWGVGSLTARFLATTNLARAQIAGFVDSNRGHQGKQLLGKEIAAPSSLAGRTETVFVSSFVYGEEIRSTLENEIRYRGRIVTI